MASDVTTKGEEQWRTELSPEQYKVLRRNGTERAFSGAYVHETRQGAYHCAGCGEALFSSDAKFDSGTGWPSFTEPVSPERIDTKSDWKLLLPRTEVRCSCCGGHLGHVFKDGPRPTGKRFCINSVSLEFRASSASSGAPAGPRTPPRSMRPDG